MSLALIAAVAKNRCIGKTNQIPWYIPEDLKRFKALTMGKIVMMGRKTWESLPERFRPLPGRTNIVITRQTDYALPEGVERFGTIEDALRQHAGEEIFVIGGGELYRETIPLAHRLYITQVDQTVDGDVFFPKIDPEVWQEMEREDHQGFSFVIYER